MSQSLYNLFLGMSILAWILVYVLMIRRGFIDKSYGMPVTALCFNLAWEFYFTFLGNFPMTSRIGNGLFFVLDLGMFYTCLRFGKDDFDWPIFKRNFFTFIALMIPVSFVMIRTYVTAFHDYGMLVTLYAQLLYSTLLPAMLIRRDSVKGQSFYIGLFILIGDTCSFLIAPATQRLSQPDAPLVWITVCNAYIFLAHVFYLALYCHVAGRDGVNIWKRF